MEPSCGTKLYGTKPELLEHDTRPVNVKGIPKTG
eukprot:SAG11_NODE_9794_length_880_cov_1.032010_1_plen_33_part_10